MTKNVFGVGNGLPSAWLSKMKAMTHTAWWMDTLTAPSDGLSNRDEWVDQIAIGYVASSEFAQNFRSSLNFGSSWEKDTTGDIKRNAACTANVAQCVALIDQRIEQGDSDVEDKASNPLREDSGYAFQTAFAGTSGPNRYGNSTTGIVSGSPKLGPASPGGSDCTNPTDAGMSACGQDEANNLSVNVEQSTEGFFYACMNCNANNNEHSFTPPNKLAFQTWPTRPKITKINHADASTQTTWTP
jgi:hypothetical protein